MITLYGFDIETDTTDGHGLNPNLAGVTSAAVWSNDEAVVFDSRNERALLGDIADYFDSTYREPGCVITWNGSVFDLPFLVRRAQLLRVDTLGNLIRLTYSPLRPVKYQVTPGFIGGYLAQIGRHDHADIQWAYKEHADKTGVVHSMKPVAETLGIDAISVDRERIHDLSRMEQIAYNLSDVNVAHQLAARIETFSQWRDSFAVDV